MRSGATGWAFLLPGLAGSGLPVPGPSSVLWQAASGQAGLACCPACLDGRPPGCSPNGRAQPRPGQLDQTGRCCCALPTDATWDIMHPAAEASTAVMKHPTTLSGSLEVAIWGARYPAMQSCGSLSLVWQHPLEVLQSTTRSTERPGAQSDSSMLVLCHMHTSFSMPWKPAWHCCTLEFRRVTKCCSQMSQSSPSRKGSHLPLTLVSSAPQLSAKGLTPALLPRVNAEQPQMEMQQPLAHPPHAGVLPLDGLQVAILDGELQPRIPNSCQICPSNCTAGSTAGADHWSQAPRKTAGSHYRL